MYYILSDLYYVLGTILQVMQELSLLEARAGL